MEPTLHNFLTKEQIGRAKQILDELELLLSIDVPADGSPEGHAAAEIRAALKLVAREIAGKITAIETDRDLSNQGRAKAFKNLADTMLPRLQGLEKAILPKLQVKLDTLRGELTAPMLPLQKGDAAGAIRLWEIRSHLTGLDDASRLAAMWRAVEQGDAETLSAFIYAPKAFPLVDGEALTQAMAAHWRQQKPDVAEAVEVVETLSEMLATNFRSLHRVCDNLSGAVSTDPAGDGNE